MKIKTLLPLTALFVNVAHADLATGVVIGAMLGGAEQNEFAFPTAKQLNDYTVIHQNSDTASHFRTILERIKSAAEKGRHEYCHSTGFWDAKINNWFEIRDNSPAHDALLRFFEQRDFKIEQKSNHRVCFKW